jgi:hypothetical protein
LEDCKEEDAEQAQVGYSLFEEYWVYVPYSCCYSCRLPQAIYRSFEIDIIDRGYRKQAGGRYQYKGVVGKIFIVRIMRRGLQAYKVLERAIEADRGVKDNRVEEVGAVFRAIMQ